MMRGLKKRILGVCLGVVFGALAAGSAFAKEQGKTVDVVFTHDLHSYLNSYETTIDGEIKDVGGFARMKTLLDEKRAENPDTLVIDAGDFSMGTLFQTVFSTEAIEYRMLGKLGFEATTFGNHEFDYGSDELAGMFRTAAEKEEYLPPILVCNANWDAGNEGSKQIQEAAELSGLKEYEIYKKGDVNIAVLGVFGIDALECAPTCEVVFDDPIESVKRTVEKIQTEEDVDMIVCISHSGTWEDEDESEDELLAKAVPELDLIVSGHTHSTLEKPIVHGDTAIVSCGEYGKNVGTISMEQKEDGRWEIEEYELVLMDDSIEKDEEIQSILDSFDENINESYLKQFGFTADQVLTKNEIMFENLDAISEVHTEHKLGNLLSDSYRYTVDRLGTDEPPVDVAVVPSGVIRGTYQQGDITVTNVFDSFSLGNGPDKIAGYPLISVYLTGAELKTAAEVDASLSNMMTTARLYMSGLSFAYNPNRLILNKTYDVWMTPGLADDTRVELEHDKMYRVVTDLYTGRMLGAVNDMSFGILKLVPKFADGTPVERFEDCIIYDKEGREVKAWVAIATYLDSFEEDTIPSYYEEYHDRKVVEDSKKIGDWLKNPSKYAWMILGVVVLLLLILIALIVVVVRVVKKFRRRKIGRK